MRNNIGARRSSKVMGWLVVLGSKEEKAEENRRLTEAGQPAPANRQRRVGKTKTRKIHCLAHLRVS
jgi:hypothetical protein